nr:solute carrier family 2, facilitated glucose transporter member 6-like [Rhipicephalus microplus]
MKQSSGLDSPLGSSNKLTLLDQVRLGYRSLPRFTDEVLVHIWFQSLGLVGAVGGAVMGALSAQSLGRCRTMAVSVIGILCTWLCVGCAQEVWYLYTGRFINGFFAGMLSLVVPAQISELADPRNRGLQGARHFIGMLFGSIYVTLLGRYVTWSMLAFTCLLPVAVLVPLSWFLVESPRWLLQIGQRERAMEMQRNLRKEPVEANAEFKLMEKAFSGTPMPSLHYWLSTHIMFTQQFCGANMAATCASVLMGPTGVYADREDTDLAILITQVAVALAALPLVDTVGRLRLLVVSANVCVASMISLGSMYPNMLIDAASETTTSTLSTAANASELDVGVTIVPGSRLGLVFLIVFFFGYALGIGSVTWIQAAELTPLRGHGVEFGSVCTFHWACAFCSVTFFERVRAGFSFGEMAWFYGTLTLANGLVLYYFMPETKHLPLESILLDECPIEDMLGRRRSITLGSLSRGKRPTFPSVGYALGVSLPSSGPHVKSDSTSFEVPSPFKSDRSPGVTQEQPPSTHFY